MALERENGTRHVSPDELQRVNKIRRDFVANVSHELKTPATSLKLLAESLEKTLDEDPVQALLFAAQLKKETERLAHLITDLLDLARLESQEPIDYPTLVDVRSILMTVLARFDPREIEEVGDDPREALRVSMHRIEEGACVLRILQRAVEQRLRIGADDRHWSAELVGDVGDEVASYSL